MDSRRGRIQEAAQGEVMKNDDDDPLAPRRTAGSAFPSPETENYDPLDGLTKRDYFAAAALTGLLMTTAQQTPANLGDIAYKFADAMIRAREAK